MRANPAFRFIFILTVATFLTACTIGSIINIPNDPPFATFTALPQTGAGPLLVTFNGVASTDSDGTIVLYEWDYQGDGTFDASLAVPGTTFTYVGLPGAQFAPVLRVTDDEGDTGVFTGSIMLT